MSRVFTKDHITVIKVLGKELPKKPALTTAEIAKLGFRAKGDKADRTVRNAYRKLRAQELIEITDRGMYRLTSNGAAMAKKIAEKGDTAFTQSPEKAKKAEKKPAKKKTVTATKKAEKKPAKAVKATAKAKKPTAKSPAKKATKTPAKASPKVKVPEKKEAPKSTPTPVKVASPEKAPEKAKPVNGSNGRSALEKLRGVKKEEKVTSPTLPVV